MKLLFMKQICELSSLALHIIFYIIINASMYYLPYIYHVYLLCIFTMYIYHVYLPCIFTMYIYHVIYV